VRDKTVTFIKIADLKDNTIIPKSNDKNLGLEYAEGRNGFSDR
jgi:glucose-6-phosphate isomerase